MLVMGVMEPVQMKLASQIVFVQKKGRSTFIFIDCSRLKAMMIKNLYLIPPMDDFIKVLCDENIAFSTLNVNSEYWKGEIAKEDRVKFTYSSKHSLF